MFTFVVPARNEAQLIGRTLDAIECQWRGWPIVVVDNASSDGTGALVAGRNVTVVTEARAGKGFALHRGIRESQTEWCFICDADITGLNRGLVDCLAASTPSSSVLARLALGREPQHARVSTLCVRPLLKALGLPQIREPIGGLALVRRDFFLAAHLPGGWGIDIGLTLAAMAAGNAYVEASGTGISHRHRSLDELATVADEVVLALLRAAEVLAWDHSDCVRCSMTTEQSPALEGKSSPVADGIAPHRLLLPWTNVAATSNQQDSV